MNRKIYCSNPYCKNILDLDEIKIGIYGGVRCPKCELLTPLFPMQTVYNYEETKKIDEEDEQQQKKGKQN